MKNFLEVKGLCFGYLKQPLCLKDVSFSAAEKDKILVLGLNDKGKTSLLKCLSGFEPKFFGYVFLNKKEIRQIADSDKNVSLILDYPILINSTIDKNLNFAYENIGKEIVSEEQKIKLLRKFNLNFELKAKVKKLSLFEKFKLCLLRTFIKNPKVIFVDDILKNDFSCDEKKELMQIIDELAKEKLLIMAMSDETFSRDRDLVCKQDFSKILYLNNAKITEYETLDEFSKNPFDLDAVEFADNLTKIEGYCVYQDGDYYLCFGEFTLKIDRNLNSNFDKLKLDDGENEDVVLVRSQNLDIDFSKNNDFNKLLKNKQVFIFSKLDRSRVI